MYMYMYEYIYIYNHKNRLRDSSWFRENQFRQILNRLQKRNMRGGGGGD